MLNVSRKIMAATLAATLVLCLAPRAQAALIPHNLDAAAGPAELKAADAALTQAGLTPSQARVRSATLDRVELARLEKTDLTQKGGDSLVLVLAIIGAAAVIVWILRGID